MGDSCGFPSSDNLQVEYIKNQGLEETTQYSRALAAVRNWAVYEGDNFSPAIQASFVHEFLNLLDSVAFIIYKFIVSFFDISEFSILKCQFLFLSSYPFRKVLLFEWESLNAMIFH